MSDPFDSYDHMLWHLVTYEQNTSFTYLVTQVHPIRLRPVISHIREYTIIGSQDYPIQHPHKMIDLGLATILELAIYE